MILFGAFLLVVVYFYDIVKHLNIKLSHECNLDERRPLYFVIAFITDSEHK